MCLKYKVFVVFCFKKIYNYDGDIMKEEEIIKKIKEVIDRIRPYLQNDGGDVKFNRFENGVVYVSMVGACLNCMAANVTLEDGIEAALLNEVPEVIKVVNEN